MNYEVIFSKQPQDFLDKLDNSVRYIVIKKLEKLKENPHLGEPLTGNLSGLRKLRTDKYRIIYKIVHQELLVLVVEMGHRKNVYD